MKRFYKFLMPLVAIVAMALPLKASAQSSVLIADGTTTNSYVPLYGLWMDDYTRTQCIYPASMLDDITTGSAITSLTFYTSDAAYTYGAATFDVKLGEVSQTTLDSYLTYTATTVYTGSVEVSNNQMVVNFDVPYVYMGGNLMIEFYQTVEGTFHTTNFYGVTATGASASGYSSSGASGATFNQRNFLPKVQIEYAEGGTITCYRVKNLTVSDIDTSEVTLHWLDTNNVGATYNVAYWTNPNDTVTLTSTDTFYTVTGLNPSTVYYFGVWPECTDGTSAGMAMVNARTNCAPLATLPYTLNFAACASGSNAQFDPCWSIGNNYSTSSNYPYYSTSGYLYTYLSGSGKYAYAMLPEIGSSLATTDMELSFKAWNSSTSSYGGGLIVALFNDDTYTDGDAFDTITVIVPTASSQTTAETFYVNIVNQNLTGKRIGFLFKNMKPGNTSTSYYNYMKDVDLHEAPTCFVPSDLTLDVAGETTLDFSWSDDANSSASYWVEYRPLGTDAWSGVEVSSASASLTALNSNTVYEIQVRALCGAGDTSFALLGSFRTACATISMLPYVLNLDACETGSAAHFDPCWSIGNNYSTTSNYPYYSTSGYLYTYLYNSSSANSLYAYAMLPELDDVLATTDLELSFTAWNSSTASYGAGLLVAVFDSSAYAAGDAIDTIAVILPTATSQAAAETYYVPIVGHNLTGKRIGFLFQNQKTTSSTSYYNYMKDVNLHEAPTCLVPFDFIVNAAQADSVILDWGDTLASSWQVAVGAPGFNPDTVENPILATDSELVLDELVGGESYQAYVRADCGDEQSMWIGPVSFTPGAINMGTSGSATMSLCGAVIYDNGGATGSYDNNCDYTLTLYPSDDTKRFKFWGSGNTEANYDYLRVYAGATASGTMLGQIYGQNQTIDTVLTQGGPITLKFHSDGSTVYSGFEFHVVCVDLAACRDIAEVSVPEVSASSAYVTWTNTTGTTPLANSYIVTVTDTAGVTVATITTTDMYAIVSGLQANNDYTVSVIPSCDEADGQPATATFTTASFGCLTYDTTGTGAPYQIGDGTGTSYYLPIGNYYNYSYTQQIFDASELNGAMPITGIDFQYAYGSSNTYKTDVTIYLANVTASSLASSFVPYDANTFVPVYSGSLVCTNGWNHFTFDTVFQYDGTSNLLVVVHDNSGDYNGSSYVFATHNTVAGKGRYVQNDDAAYSISSVSGGTSVSYRANVRFTTYACAVSATCAVPLVMTNVDDATTVTLTWAAGGNETSWNVDHMAVTDADWTIDLTNTTANTFTIGNLTPNTEYLFRVYHICGTDTFATVRTVRTACVGADVPFFENFSTWASGTTASLPDACWFKGSSYNANYPYVSTSYSLPGDNNSMYFYASGTTTTYLALPKFSAPLDTLIVSGYIYYSGNGYTLNVGRMTDPEDESTFQPVSVVTSVANQWVPFEVSFAGQPDGYIAFANGNDGSYSYIYLDNIEVNYYNPCERPTNVGDRNVTTTTATVYWTDTVTTDFVVEYGPVGFAHGTGTVVNVSNADTVQLTGLSHSTLYDVYVRGLCDGDSSNWSFVHRLSTQCGAIDVLPYTETFTNWGSGTSSHAPMCWTYGSNYSSSYPYISVSYNHSGNGGGAMYMYDGSSAGSTNKTWFALPALASTTATINQTELIFYTYSSTTSYDHPVMVGVGKNSTLDTTVVWIDTVYPTYSQWTEHEVSLDSYNGTGSYIFFSTHVGGTYAYSYPYIDDITLEMIPSCRRPDDLYATNATSTTVEMGWNERSGATQWIIEYGPTGFPLGTGTQIVANSNPFTVTGLPVAYQGEFYVRSICGVGDTGEFSRHPQGFATSQIPATLPYNYDFEDPAEWANWQVSTNSETNNWYRGTAVADSGSYAIYMSADSGATYRPYDYNAVVNAAAFRDIDFGPIDSSYTISFRARVGGTISANYDGLMVFLVDPALPTVASNNNITSPWGNVNDLYRIASIRRDTTWQTYDASFDTISGVHRVAFFWFNQNTGASYPNLIEPAAIDNIHIDYSTCPRPLNLEAATVGGNSATLIWDGASSATYEVVYRIPGQANQTILTTTNSVVLTGLNGSTEYYAWVRKLCGVGDTSLYSDGVSFTTAMCDGAEMVVNYDTTLTSSTVSAYSPIGYSFYNYGYTQTIIDSAVMAQLTGDVTGFGFLPVDNDDGNDMFDGMTIFMANVPESDLSSGFIHPDATHVFHRVLNGASLSWSDDSQGDWIFHSLDTAFVWDGHSNVLFAVKRDNGDYEGSTDFQAHTATTSKMRYIYQDSGPYDYTSVTGGTASTTVGDIMLVSCGGIHCAAPIVTSFDTTFNSITLNWANSDNTELAIMEGAWDETMVNNTVTAASGTYTFTGLTDSTEYSIGLRQMCEDDMTSDWTVVTILTPVRPCFVPTNPSASDVTLTTATLSWTPGRNETAWDLHVMGEGYDQTFAVTTNPYTVTGLSYGVTYTFEVRANCDADVYSDWSTSATFTTLTCQPVTGVNVNPNTITANSAVVSWTAPQGATNFEIEYGMSGFNQGNGIIVAATGTSHTLTDLSSTTVYDVYVRTVCGEGVTSAWSSVVDFTTADGEGIDDVNSAAISLYPNPASSTVTLMGIEGAATVTVVDMNGRETGKWTVVDGTLTIDVTEMTQGAYFVRIVGEQVNAIRKLIVR